MPSCVQNFIPTIIDGELIEIYKFLFVTSILHKLPYYVHFRGP